ncbi:hypothetical protein [Peromfec virus RodF8_47]|uniref:Uncharacterized protein n=1 Tax=Peromfec virus RodF8_47 TaxID=2929378 RepID=A0A976N2K5_9VIRU|nr:hypothetical protein [Peromfec virus RodF8_47]
MIIYSNFGVTPEPDVEVLTSIDDTIPDQSLSVREILQRYAVSGQPLPPVDSGEDDDIDAPDETFGDLVDAQNAVSDGYDVYHRTQASFRSSESSAPSDAPPSDTPPSDSPSVSKPE